MKEKMTTQLRFFGVTIIFTLFLFLFPGIVSGTSAEDTNNVKFAEKPEYAVLFIIDGLSYKVWDQMELPVLKEMIKEGALVEKNYLPPAAHPHTGKYADLHSCSVPNPILMAGTVFITKETEYLPQNFFPDKTTAFVANTLAYRSLNRYYNYSYQKGGPDSESVNIALKFMEMGHPVFMRVHLQTPGNAGYECMITKEDVPWRSDIWAKGSPYRLKTEEADSLLGVFINGLKEQGVLEKTVIIVMGDHGQADAGWHPVETTNSSITTIVLWGAGIKKGVRIPYSEQIDIVPTISALMGVEPPKTSRGRIIAEALSQYEGELPPKKMLFKKMLEQFKEYRKKKAQAIGALEASSSSQVGRLYSEMNNIDQNFYDIHRFLEWPRFRTVEELLENNSKVLTELDRFLSEIQNVDY
ncbi:MAG: sulfatase-like hydrolase/transferase [Bacteroidales bacterium]|nr:sulfatase-like hydrolase/transferase [Bacteroidales bacterium]